jgi:hypothetical protein
MVMLPLSSKLWALLNMWIFFSLPQHIVFRFEKRKIRTPPKIATDKNANKMILQNDLMQCVTMFGKIVLVTI